MRHLVPAFKLRSVFQTKVGRQVDDPDAGVDELPRLRHGNAMRSREKNHVAGSQIRFGRIAEAKFSDGALATQAWEHGIDRGARFRARSDDADVRVRMHREQPQQLHAGVAGAAHDAHVDSGCLHWMDSSTAAPPYDDGIGAKGRGQNAKAASRRPWSAKLSASRTVSGGAPCAIQPSCVRPRAHLE